jgi:hypothetical protein
MGCGGSATCCAWWPRARQTVFDAGLFAAWETRSTPVRKCDVAASVPQRSLGIVHGPQLLSGV